MCKLQRMRRPSVSTKFDPVNISLSAVQFLLAKKKETTRLQFLFALPFAPVRVAISLSSCGEKRDGAGRTNRAAQAKGRNCRLLGW